MSAKEDLELLPPEGWGYKCAPPHLVYEVLGLAPTKAFYKLSYILCVWGRGLLVCVHMYAAILTYAYVRSMSGIFFFSLLYFYFFLIFTVK